MDLRAAYEGERVLVTGAAGFVASHLVDGLVALGARVRALDNLRDGRLENLEASRDRIEFLERSVLDREALEEAVEGCAYVFHLAANALVPRSAEDPDYDFAVNVLGTRNVMEALRRTGGGTLVFTSSAAVYGEPLAEPMDEEHPLQPKSPYGGSKLAAEFLLEAYARCYGFDHRRLRLFNTYGPRQRKYVMFDLLEKLRRDPTRLEVLGTGAQVRDYSYVEDTVQAILLVGAHPEARGKVFNVSGMDPISIRELASLLIELLEIDPPEVRYTGESWQGDVVRMIGDTARLRALGYEPSWDLRRGLRELIAWHREEFAPPW
jgi:UDP-glucose 4-epimerase